MTSVPDTATPRRRENRIASLDVVRGLAILMVIATHNPVFPGSHGLLYTPLVVAARIGWSGVDLFFVLSGFLVGGLLMREQKQTGGIDAAHFLMRRAFKVWPSYFAFLAAYAAAQILDARSGGTAGSRAGALARDLWPNLVHVQNYFASTSQLGWLWSLAVEEHFYLALPWILMWVFRPAAPRAAARRIAVVSATIAVGCLLLRARAGRLAPPSPATPYLHVFPTHLRADSLFAGVLLAYIAEFRGHWMQRLRPVRYVLLAVGLAPWFACYVFADREQVLLYPWGLTLLYLGSACVVAFAHLQHLESPAGSRGRLRRWVVTVVAWIGVRSYCIYVWHGYFAKPIANRLAHLAHLAPGETGVRGWIYDGIYLVIPILLGAATYVAIEKPGLDLRRRLLVNRSTEYRPSIAPLA
jgi:peptidoglycan/LPS O-acetylase OafA/YrhL